MSAKEISNKRIDYIDIAKGIGMLLVIWGHIRETGISNRVIYSFHMPLFFALSGMVFNDKKYNSFYKLFNNRIYSMIMPYITYSIITWVIWCFYNLLFHNNVVSYLRPLIQTFISQGSGGYLIHNSTLWFVTCLFCVEMISYYICKANILYAIIICIILTVIGNFMILPNSHFRYLPWSFDMALCALPFYFLGFCLFKYRIHEYIYNSIKSNKILSFLVVTFILFVIIKITKYNGYVSMGHRKLNSPFIFYPIAILGIIEIIAISMLIESCKYYYKWICWIGKNSFDFMAIQTPIKGLVVVFLSVLLHKSVINISNSSLYSLIAFFISFILVNVCVINIEMIKNKFLSPKILLSKNFDFLKRKMFNIRMIK